LANILGIHFAHDSSVCLFENGELKKYFLVERFTRVKHDSNSISGMKKIFKNINTKIDYICISGFNLKDKDQEEFIVIEEIYKKLKKENPDLKIINRTNHHLNHAYPAFYNSGFEESLVIVIDGNGSVVYKEDKTFLVEVESVFSFNKKENQLVYKNIVEYKQTDTLSWNSKLKEISFDNYDYKNIFGIGMLYDTAAILTGNTSDDCGKAMGLSSYGKENSLFKNLFLSENSFNNDFFYKSSFEIKKFLKNPTTKITKKNYKFYADFCYEVQVQTQKAAGDIIEKSIEKTGIKKVCVTGGYGLNVVANYYFIKRFPDVEFYFDPVCNDNGVSIGAVMGFYKEFFKENPKAIKNTFFHGLSYDVSKYKGQTKNVKEIAEILTQNKSVAVFRGLAESGQRALGNRSIFFNALNKDAKKIVNKIKKREWYRPFACIVLEKDAEKYFYLNNIKSSPFMTMCFPVKEKYWDVIPGVTHVDKTCRIQTVNKSDGYLYNLLNEFKKRTGHGIILNTSFNLAGEPLVETPNQAFDVLKKSNLDFLWFEETKQFFQ
jgi:carbamoyltransferase